MGERIYLSPPWMSGAELPLIEEAFASKYVAPCGPMVDRFEREFERATGMPHACALASGTGAMDLLCHELRIGAGDTVFCSDLTFVASIAPAVHRGATPVFIDCDERSWTMDVGLLDEALADAAKAGRLPKAVVAVDLYGQCCDYDRIEAACARHGVPLIVDAAEALGARYWGGDAVGKEPLGGVSDEGRHAGAAGWAALYSFNGNKIITTSGGGMLASRDAGVVERARKRSQQSREPAVWYEHAELGYNYRMSNIVAAIGVGQLASLERIIEKKRRIFEGYRERLGDRVGFMPEAAYGRCTRWLTVATLGGGEGATGGPSPLVERVRLGLERENIESRPVWKPMHMQPVFSGAKTYGGGCCERLFAEGLCLPSGTGLTEDDVARICEALGRAAV